MSEGTQKRIERLSPPLEAVLLDEITIAVNNLSEGVNKLTKVVESTIPRGERPSFLRDITNELVDIKASKYPYPWFSLQIFNYGPDPVYVGINKEPELDPIHGDELRVGETIEVDMKAAKIDKVYCQCLPTQTAQIRIRGVY